MPEPVLFRGARVVDPASGTDEVADVLVDGGVIASSPGAHATILDCDGIQSQHPWFDTYRNRDLFLECHRVSL